MIRSPSRRLCHGGDATRSNYLPRAGLRQHLYDHSHAAEVNIGNPQPVAVGWVVLDFLSVARDPQSLISLVADTFTIKIDGWYTVSVSGRWEAEAHTYTLLALSIDGTYLNAVDGHDGSTSTSNTRYLSSSWTRWLTTGQVIKVLEYQSVRTMLFWGEHLSITKVA